MKTKITSFQQKESRIDTTAGTTGSSVISTMTTNSHSANASDNNETETGAQLDSRYGQKVTPYDIQDFIISKKNKNTTKKHRVQFAHLILGYIQ